MRKCMHEYIKAMIYQIVCKEYQSTKIPKYQNTKVPITLYFNIIILDDPRCDKIVCHCLYHASIRIDTCRFDLTSPATHSEMRTNIEQYAKYAKREEYAELIEYAEYAELQSFRVCNV
jgi:hypothetical protein